MVILFQMTIGRLIKDTLEKKGISQVALADKIGLTAAQVSRIISGERNTSIDTLLLIADALQINRDVIIKVAANLPPEPDSDPWVEMMDYKLRSLPPGARGIAERLINSVAEQEEANRKGKLKPKRAE